MPNRRAEIAMTGAEVAAFLAAGRTLVLVTLGPDGLPDPVPMWYLPDGDGLEAPGAVRMRTFRKSQKVRNLRRDPRAVGLVEDGERYVTLRGVQLTGRVELVDDPAWIADVVVGLMAKYEQLAPEHWPVARDAALAGVGKQIGLRLVVDQVVSWDHGKLGTGEAR
jgi:PPOX class probable F420-dependent enzyme